MEFDKGATQRPKSSRAGDPNALANYLVVEYLTNRDYSLSGSLTPRPHVHPCSSLPHERNEIITRSNCNVHDILPVLRFENNTFRENCFSWSGGANEEGDLRTIN